MKIRIQTGPHCQVAVIGKQKHIPVELFSLSAAPPSTLALTSPPQAKKKVLVAPTLSLSLGNETIVCEQLFIFLPDRFSDDLRRLGVASGHHRGHSSDPQTGCLMETDQSGLGFLEREDVVDSHGTRWRCFTTGDPPQESRVNMSVLEPFLRVLSHGGYYGDGMNDIIVFSSCYLPENCLENYQYVMDNLFRFVVGTLELMVAENYVIVYLCAGGQKDKLPGISWLRECYTTIDRRLRKNLKGFYVVHPTWYIKALITIIKPFISTKFSRKLQFISSLKELSNVIPTEHVQIPDCKRKTCLWVCDCSCFTALWGHSHLVGPEPSGNVNLTVTVSPSLRFALK
uniref:CRAL-TRIO domain-containing protein n=1 Tax=Neolamprologus brichardi TaxID=32507 RepID=A0A3Q4N896_NEOBR